MAFKFLRRRQAENLSARCVRRLLIQLLMFSGDLHLRLQKEAGLFLHHTLDFLDKGQHIGADSVPGVDDKAGVLFADPGPADLQALKAALVDKGGGIGPLRALKGASGAGPFQGLFFPAAAVYLVHPGGDGAGAPFVPPEPEG